MSENINLDDFDEIEKVLSGIVLPSNVLRIGSGISLGEDISKKLLGKPVVSFDKIALKMQYSAKRKMIRLERSNPREGFIFGVDKGQRSLTMNSISTAMKAYKIPRGEYEEIPGSDNIFVWKRPFKLWNSHHYLQLPSEKTTEKKESFSKEDTNIEVADVICWVTRLRGAKRDEEKISTGKVTRVFVNVDDEEMLEIEPISTHLTQSLYFVKKRNVIIRRKHDE